MSGRGRNRRNSRNLGGNLGGNRGNRGQVQAALLQPRTAYERRNLAIYEDKWQAFWRRSRTERRAFMRRTEAQMEAEWQDFMRRTEPRWQAFWRRSRAERRAFMRRTEAQMEVEWQDYMRREEAQWQAFWRRSRAERRTFRRRIEAQIKAERQDYMRRTAAKRQLVASYEASIQDFMRRAEAMDAKLRRQQAMQQAKDAMQQAKDEGRYFSLIDDVFQPIAYSSSIPTTERAAKNALKKVCRSQAQVSNIKEKFFKNGDQNGVGVKVYNITYSCADDSNKGAATKNDRTSTQSSTKDLIWPVNIFGVKGPTRGDIAHLLPASKKNAETYWFVADFLYGYDENRSWGKTQRLIHGTLDGTSKAGNTGIKHSVPNKFILANQKDNFDKRPDVLIIPICDLEEAKSWTGQGYEAIVLIDASKGNLSSLKEARNQDLSGVKDRIRFHAGNLEVLASREEVEKAHNLAKAYAYAIIGAQRFLAPEKSRPIDSNGKSTNRAMPVILFENKDMQYFDTKLTWNRNVKIRKIQFSGHDDAYGGHPAPDPILLATRAAIQLQRRRGIALAGVDKEEDDDETDELSALAMEEFLLERRERQRFKLEEQILGDDIAIDMGNIDVQMGGIESDIEMDL